ncbi:MAG: hypothetical protein C0418_05375 [Coriobacteriaceae bacterium]|nr:hypothetical protein [Coriobacteriaceae bacterium]
MALVAVMVFGAVSPAMAARRSVFVHKPYTARYSNKVGVEFKAWGWVAPKMRDLDTKRVEIQIFKRTGPAKYEFVRSVDATLFNAPRFRNSTRYKAMVSVDATGSYRMRAKLTLETTPAVTHKRTTFSSFKYFRARP